RAIGDRHDQPCQEREGLAASLPAHTTTRPQGRMKATVWPCGCGEIRTLTRADFESRCLCLLGYTPENHPPQHRSAPEDDRAPARTCTWVAGFGVRSL